MTLIDIVDGAGIAIGALFFVLSVIAFDLAMDLVDPHNSAKREDKDK